jgi:hypothetical protein
MLIILLILYYLVKCEHLIDNLCFGIPLAALFPYSSNKITAMSAKMSKLQPREVNKIFPRESIAKTRIELKSLLSVFREYYTKCHLLLQNKNRTMNCKSIII